MWTDYGRLIDPKCAYTGYVMVPSDFDVPTLLARRSASGKLHEATVASERPVGDEAAHWNLQRGEMIDRYVVIDRLGAGGMGVVYAAFDPELDRKVAIKLVRYGGGMAKSAVNHARLLREAQALAKLTHPHVVGVYDAGTWNESVFVAMEFIEGETLCQWISRAHDGTTPSWRAVLSLMIPAGRGLAAAHSAGIIHRDFKPDNVMISRSGRVLVLDFGLARASDDQDSTGASSSGSYSRPGSSSGAPNLEFRTEVGNVVGTPAYMSPEQFGAANCDVASDQFSYCVVLYQALYGERPFAGRTLGELTSSVFLGTIKPAARGHSVPAWLRKVVLRGLAIDAADRWSSMDELLAILARDPFRRRNRALAAVGGLGLLGVGGMIALRATAHSNPCLAAAEVMQHAWGQNPRIALERAFRAEAKSYSESSVERVEQALDDYAADWVQHRRAVCEAGRQVGTEAGREASVAGSCLDRHLLRFEALVRLFGHADQTMVVRAIAAVQELPAPQQCFDERSIGESVPLVDDAATQEAVESIRLRIAEVRALISTERLSDALELGERLLEEAQSLGFAPVVAETLYLSGRVHAMQGAFDLALPRLEESLLVSRAHGLEMLEVELLSALVFVHTVYTSQFELAAWQVRILAVLVERVSGEPSRRAQVLVDRGRLERARGQLDQSIELFERAVDILVQAQNRGMALITAYEHLASAYNEAERVDEAAHILEQAQQLAQTTLGASHPHHGNLLAHFARIEAARENHGASASKLQAGLMIFEQAYGDEHPNVAAVLNGLGLQQESLGRVTDAIESFRRALAISRRIFGDDHRQVAIIQSNLGNLLRREGRGEEALELHSAAEAIRRQLDVDIESRYEILDNLADDLRVLGRCEEANAKYQAAIDLRKTVDESNPPGVGYAELGMGLCEVQRGHYARAREIFEDALRKTERAGAGPSSDLLALLRFSLAMVVRSLEPKSERAERWAQPAYQHWRDDPIEYAVLLEELGRWRAGGPVGAPTY